MLAGLGYTIDLGAGPVILALYCRSDSEFVEPRTDGVGSLGARPADSANGSILSSGSAPCPGWCCIMLSNYAIGGSFKPANANPEYFRWPGSPF